MFSIFNPVGHSMKPKNGKNSRIAALAFGLLLLGWEMFAVKTEPQGDSFVATPIWTNSELGTLILRKWTASS